MSEAKYWEEYDAAKSATLKMAAKLSARENGLMVRALHCNMKEITGTHPSKAKENQQLIEYSTSI